MGEKFSVGDVVRLKSGRIPMTVRIADGRKVYCDYDAGEKSWVGFEEMLVPAQPVTDDELSLRRRLAREAIDRDAADLAAARFMEIVAFVADIRDTLDAGPEASLSDLGRMAAEQRVALLDAQRVLEDGNGGR